MPHVNNTHTHTGTHTKARKPDDDENNKYGNNRVGGAESSATHSLLLAGSEINIPKGNSCRMKKLLSPMSLQASPLTVTVLGRQKSVTISECRFIR